MKLIAGICVMMTCASAAALRIRVTDEAGRPAWTRLEVRGPDGRMYQAAGAIVDKTARNRPGGLPYYLDSFVVHGECQLEVPAGRYTVIAEHGPEYGRAEMAISVPEQNSVNLRMEPWIRMRERGWYSGDMHVHRPPEDAPALSLAEDLNVSIVTTMWNRRNLWAGKPYPRDNVVEASPRNLVTILNAEDERGGGAWMMHALPRPLKNLAVEGRWFPPGIDFVREARAMRPRDGLLPWFDCEKPFWWEVPVMVALATPDSMGVLHNHFNQYGVHAAEAWGRPRDQKKFPGDAGFVEFSLGLYYRYLNLGFKMPPSAGSASGVLPGPVGYSRMYARVKGPFSLGSWYAAVRHGDVFVTNGPMLFLEKSGASAISVEVVAREPIDRVELVANGSVIHTFPGAGDKKKFQGQFTFDPNRHSWIAARAFVKADNTIRLAHSAPIYLPGKFDASEDARYFVEWIDDLIVESDKDPKRFSAAAEREAILLLYRQAKAVYEARRR